MPDILLGLIYHWIGGLASASFYLPYRFVRRWSWETYWMVGGFFSWIIAPLLAVSILVPDWFSLLRQAPIHSLMWAYFFGALWGVGGLTFGLTLRYLGMALGMAVALGFCAACGTLAPPIFSGDFFAIATTTSGMVILVGVAITLLGISINGFAGMRKERELTPEQKTAAIKEFNFGKGMLMAVFSGIMSSCFAYGLASGKPLADLARNTLAESGHAVLWQNLPVLVVVLWGGFTTNCIWSFWLSFRKKTYGEYVQLNDSAETGRESLPTNYFFCACAGVTWYLQFFFYSMGQTKMGAYEFSSWTLHMASIIIFSTIWGWLLREWKGTSLRTHMLVGLGLLGLLLSTIVIGWGNYLGSGEKASVATSSTEHRASH